MDFARQQRDPTRHLIGITFVVLVHAIVIYALVTGLARKAIEVIKKPLYGHDHRRDQGSAAAPAAAAAEEDRRAAEGARSPTFRRRTFPCRRSLRARDLGGDGDAAHGARRHRPARAAGTACRRPNRRYGAGPFRYRASSRSIRARPSGQILRRGRVVARLQVNEKGKVTEVTIVDANPRRVFDSSVIRRCSNGSSSPMVKSTLPKSRSTSCSTSRHRDQAKKNGRPRAAISLSVLAAAPRRLAQLVRAHCVEQRAPRSGAHQQERHRDVGHAQAVTHKHRHRAAKHLLEHARQRKHHRAQAQHPHQDRRPDGAMPAGSPAREAAP